MPPKKRVRTPTRRAAPPAAVPDAPELAHDVDLFVPGHQPEQPRDPMSTLADLPIDHDEDIGRMISSYETKFETPKRPAKPARPVKARPKAPPPRRPAVHLSLYRKLATTFIVLAVLLLGFVLYISFSRATVNVVRMPLPIRATFPVLVQATSGNDQAVVGAVLETVAEGKKTVAASGEKKTVDAKACGTVTITNEQTSSQQLVVTTRLLSQGGILFRLTEGVTVPAKGQVDAQACADQPGESGNIGAGKFTIPGLNATLQEKTYAVSTESMTGGVIETSVMTQAQIDEAVEAYAKQVADEAVEKLKGLLATPEMGTGSFVTHNIVRRENTAEIGKEQSSFDVSVAVHVNVVFYDRSAVERLARNALKAQLGDDQEVRTVDKDAFSIILKKQDAAAKTAELDVSASGAAVLTESATVFDGKQLIGMTVAEVEEHFMAVPGVGEVTVTLSPGWTKRLPNLPDHITVVVR